MNGPSAMLDSGSSAQSANPAPSRSTATSASCVATKRWPGRSNCSLPIRQLVRVPLPTKPYPAADPAMARTPIVRIQSGDNPTNPATAGAYNAALATANPANPMPKPPASSSISRAIASGRTSAPRYKR